MRSLMQLSGSKRPLKKTFSCFFGPNHTPQQPASRFSRCLNPISEEGLTSRKKVPVGSGLTQRDRGARGFDHEKKTPEAGQNKNRRPGLCYWNGVGPGLCLLHHQQGRATCGLVGCQTHRKPKGKCVIAHHHHRATPIARACVCFEERCEKC